MPQHQQAHSSRPARFKHSYCFPVASTTIADVLLAVQKEMFLQNDTASVAPNKSDCLNEPLPSFRTPSRDSIAAAPYRIWQGGQVQKKVGIEPHVLHTF